MTHDADADDDDQYMAMLANSPKFLAMLQSDSDSIAAGRGIPAKEFWRQVRERANQRAERSKECDDDAVD